MTMTQDGRPAFIGVLDLRKLGHMSGLEMLHAMLAGELPAPPISRTMNFWMTEAGEGTATFIGEPTADFLNPLGTVHGGWTGTIMDSALACAVHATLQPGEGYTTLEYKVSCLRPILPTTGRLTCIGEVVHRGRRAATSQARLVDASGKLYAHGTETCMIFDAGGRS
ncbi:MAG: PaaI family thioesterase [Hyphomonas sp.]|jgi:uncharacterized protein (TIGR00369 family)|nr:PaaI family thioesterase [Hyphomonas sp.]